MMDRREFLVASCACGGIGAAFRQDKIKYKLSVAAYSMRKYLDLKKPTMTLEEFIKKCREWGVEGTELTEYYFPKPVTSEYVQKIKKLCADLNLEVTGTPIGNTFTLPPGDARDKQISSVKRWIDVSAELGSPAIRIFAGNTSKGVDAAQAIQWAVECIEECLKHAEEKKVYLALENHGGVVSTSEGMLEFVKAIKHKWFGFNLDTGNFHTADPYHDMELCAPYAVTCQVKTEVSPKGGKKQDADYAKIVSLLRKGQYKGYMTLEYEAAEEPLIAIPKALAGMRKAAETA